MFKLLILTCIANVCFAVEHHQLFTAEKECLASFKKVPEGYQSALRQYGIASIEYKCVWKEVHTS